MGALYVTAVQQQSFPSNGSYAPYTLIIEYRTVSGSFCTISCLEIALLPNLQWHTYLAVKICILNDGRNLKAKFQRN